MGHFPNKQHILKLPPLPEADHYVLAYSGGSDSVALLHYLVQHQDIKDKLSAIHVNHQIHPEASQWAQHCQSSCQQYDIPCVVKVISNQKTDENRLRINRYNAFSQHLESLSGTVILLTAHHLNDDVETMIFRLLRGTGLNGVTGMTGTGNFKDITIFRPLINTPKSLISQYLLTHNLSWVEDSSNLDTNYDRNYIRHKIIPTFEQYRPDALSRLRDSRDNLSASLALLEYFIGESNPIKFDLNLTPKNLATTIYHWLANKQLNPAHRDQLLSFSRACIRADKDKMPLLESKEFVLVNWQQAIYALRPHLFSNTKQQAHHLMLEAGTFNWQHEFGRLTIESNNPISIKLIIKFNQQGEKIQLPGRNHHSRVKELLRKANIPPWQRSRLPFIYSQGILMAVGPIVSQHWQQWLMAYEAEYDWQSTNFLL